jgi:hypothetical protein
METEIKTIKNSGLVISFIRNLIKENPEFKKANGHIPVIIEVELLSELNILVHDYNIKENNKIDINKIIILSDYYNNDRLISYNDFSILYSLSLL